MPSVNVAKLLLNLCNHVCFWTNEQRRTPAVCYLKLDWAVCVQTLAPGLAIQLNAHGLIPERAPPAWRRADAQPHCRRLC